MKVHPIAKLFPLISDAELQKLADSIKKEGLLNPCIRKGDVLLDGRNRLAACKIANIKPRFIKYTGDNPAAFIIGMNLVRRHLDKGQKIALAVELEAHFAKEAKKRLTESGKCTGRGHTKVVENIPQPLRSRDQAAAAVGVSGKLVSAAKAIKEADLERFEKVKEGKLSIARAKKEIKAEQDKRELAAAQKAINARKRKSIEAICDLRVCSCAALFESGIKPDAVITDPPYPEEFLPVFTELAIACKDIPVVAIMSGQTHLPEVMRRLCEHLTYRWTIAYLTPGGQSSQNWPAKINTFWKPVLVFGQATDWIGDVARSDTNDNDKRFHDWGQSESGMADLIKRLTKPKQLICDPFLGGGSTAIASLALGRRFVGCDVDAACIKKTRARVMKESNDGGI